MHDATDKALRQLFMDNGHMAPPVDLTERIMARVEQAPVFVPIETRPLVSKRAWTVIAIVLVLLACLGLLTNTPVTDNLSLAIVGAGEALAAGLRHRTLFLLQLVIVSLAVLLLFLLRRVPEKRTATP